MYSAAVVTNLNADDMEYLKHLSTMRKLINVRSHLNPYTALAEIVDNQCELIIIDAGMPDSQALELAARFLKRRPGLLLVIVADNDDYALEALQIGVLDYIVRPVAPDRIENLEEKLKRRCGGIRDGP